MRISLSNWCRQVQNHLNSFHPSVIHMDSFTAWRRKELRKEKVVVVMGATGTGKSRLSIDIATHFDAEVINCDKMQVYRGLDIVTNKVTEDEQRGIPHHLLGFVDPNTEFTALDFRCLALPTIESIVLRGKLPIIAGGSNSYIQALVDDESMEFRSRFEYCFLWVDVALPVLSSFVSERVDRMVASGLVEEVRGIFDKGIKEADYKRGIRRAIGVPEMDKFLHSEGNADDETRARLLEEAIEEIKVNTCKLAYCQLEKIHRLRSRRGWEIHRIDATDVFLRHGHDADWAWNRLVASPAVAIVEDFLLGKNKADVRPSTAGAGVATSVGAPVAAVVAGH